MLLKKNILIILNSQFFNRFRFTINDFFNIMTNKITILMKNNKLEFHIFFFHYHNSLLWQFKSKTKNQIFHLKFLILIEIFLHLTNFRPSFLYKHKYLL